jgi:hypothetical protein
LTVADLFAAPVCRIGARAAGNERATIRDSFPSV